jgi:hypothetical protein
MLYFLFVALDFDEKSPPKIVVAGHKVISIKINIILVQTKYKLGNF